MDPTDTEEMSCTKLAGTTHNHGIIVQAVLPQHGQISEILVMGSLDTDTIIHSMDLLNKVHKDICPIIEQCLVKTVFKAFRSSSKSMDTK